MTGRASRPAPRQLAFGYTQEDLRVLIAPMAGNGEEPIGSMGNDNALAVLSDQPPAAVHATSSSSSRRSRTRRSTRSASRSSCRWAPASARERNLLDRDARARPPARHGPADPAQPRARDAAPASTTTSSSAHTIDITWPIADGRRGHADARSPTLCDEAHDAVAAGVNILILSDRAGRRRARADPVAARRRRRPPPPRARGHAPAGGPRPRVRRAARGPPLRDADRLRRQRDQPVPAVRHGRRAASPTAASPASTTPTTPSSDIVKAIGKGLLKTISKMGISTIQSYCGAQIFEAVGLEQTLVDRHFTGTASRIGGIGLDVLAQEALDRHARGVARRDHRRPAARRRRLRLAPRRRAPHVEPGDDRAAPARRPRANGDARSDEVRRVRARWSTTTPRAARRCAACCSFRDGRASRSRSTRSSRRKEIVKRFATGAMSLGSISTRGARDARDRDEPPRRQVEHRRGRGGPAPLHARRQRRPAPLGDQAGRLRAASA